MRLLFGINGENLLISSFVHLYLKSVHACQNHKVLPASSSSYFLYLKEKVFHTSITPHSFYHIKITWGKNKTQL